ncbi:lysine-specific demethylase REF6-like [Rutidosis leptorrhynchoides]|uniref:lysine-specific demethylase REF6-like n=1 Tax=Rutidosis leptorrhynchoides TaxID=125765 RepID=UPI003A9950E5
MEEEIFPWLESLPLAPEYKPTLTEFQDPIAYICKIEKVASKFGICKIIPPVSPSFKKTVISNLKQSLSSDSPNSTPTFTTRIQEVGFHRRKNFHPVQRPVWQSFKTYTLNQFERKAKKFENDIYGSSSNTDLSKLKVETMYWKAQDEKPIYVEYANDIPGSAFNEIMEQGSIGINSVKNLGESAWNLRNVARAKGSLLKFVKNEILGVTSPMIYIGMMFSWFAWHVEDHDLHSLNYMHIGGCKTWYGIPIDAAVAFEDVIRTHGYSGKISPIETCATLAQKTTVMSPEILHKVGVPCYRLVQNAGEFVVTFPRAYHSGFSHGFNCAEAVNIATPEWLILARDAAIRRASINLAPLVSHYQLLYDQALSFCTSMPSTTTTPQRSGPKENLKVEEDLVKQIFIQDVFENNELINILGNGSSITILSQEVLDFLSSTSHIPRGQNFSLFNEPANPSNMFSCVRCGIACYACCSILRPSQAVDLQSCLDRNYQRKKIYCLQHAFEVEQRLRSIGGVQWLLLCHQDYPWIEAKAKSMAKELDDGCIWTDIGYKHVNDQDTKMIQSALDH